ncbi:MAG: hypothetical protein KatS3mg028_0530 [Bacteroidia bacterium]|nr:MAG: hypothetical protein KatS3mg028_0530 [Bacteroidia bacterium]
MISKNLLKVFSVWFVIYSSMEIYFKIRPYFGYIFLCLFFSIIFFRSTNIQLGTPAMLTTFSFFHCFGQQFQFCLPLVHQGYFCGRCSEKFCPQGQVLDNNSTYISIIRHMIVVFKYLPCSAQCKVFSP